LQTSSQPNSRGDDFTDAVGTMEASWCPRNPLGCTWHLQNGPGSQQSMLHFILFWNGAELTNQGCALRSPLFYPSHGFAIILVAADLPPLSMQNLVC